jgi:acyl-CoA synthetase (AMP-forming)/AMP-acid ligase II
MRVVEAKTAPPPPPPRAAQDVIKSGGEWISSVEIENKTLGFPGVLEVCGPARPPRRRV